MMRPSLLCGVTDVFSMLEVVVSLMLFSVGALGLSWAGITASAQLRASRSDIQVWATARNQLDELTAQGFDSVTAGTDTVAGYPISWDVQGVNPKKIILVVQAQNMSGTLVPDTFVTYMADRTP